MQIKPVLNKKNWNNFFLLKEETGGSFLQSWEWGQFQQKLKRKVWYLSIQEKEKVIGQALIIKHLLPGGQSYFYCPRGPIFLEQTDKNKAFDSLFSFLKKLSQPAKAIFFRLDPPQKIELKGFKKIQDVQPSQTTILNLKNSPEKILAEMHSKTRYNIRLAEKHGVEVFASSREKDFNIFWDLLNQTAQRENFKIYPRDYYRQLLNLSPGFNRLYLAKYKNKVLAAHCVNFFNQTATYLHGGSSREEKKVMAPYLLHAQVIQEAQQENFSFYDFWGINQEKWPGLTRFKLNFGGQKISYPGTFDYAFKKIWFILYKLGKKCFR
jgi:peptidoglycan pentaglycine glycine transferase (the first glycine)